MDGAKILVVEDDANLATLLCERLERYGYRVVHTLAHNDVREQVRTLAPHLVILDINLPRYDGFHWCRQIRVESDVPILFLSGRSGPMDQVLALEGGGDDYVTKPFDGDVLLAKVGSLLRRAYGGHAVSTVAPGPAGTLSPLRLAGVELDCAQLTLSTTQGCTPLTPVEYRLMRSLFAASGQVVARAELLDQLWDDARFVDDNTLSVNVARVRRKLAAIAAPLRLETVRSAGYRLVADAGGCDA